MNGKVTISSPGKLMLFGEHAVVYGKPCIVTAVDIRLRTTIEVLPHENLEIEAPDVGITGYQKPLLSLGDGETPKGARFIECAVKNFKEKYFLNGGLRIRSTTDFSKDCGLGSSSAVTVCVLKGLSELSGLKLSNRELFDICYQTVIAVQGIGSGFDIAAALYGGTLYFKNNGQVIESLPTPLLPIVIGYSGIKANTTALIQFVAKQKEENSDRVETIFAIVETIVNTAKDALIRGDFITLGILMNQNEKLLGELNVESKELANLITAALDAGAGGAKLSGAGGGDCMIALAVEYKRTAVEQAIQKAGGIIVPAKLNAEGVRIER